ncbi:TrmB family transcriptional regulator, partial [Bacillus wiedmannii]
MSVKKLIINQKKQTEESLSFLENELQTIEKPVEVNVIKHIEERKHIIRAMQKLIEEANEEV